MGFIEDLFLDVEHYKIHSKIQTQISGVVAQINNKTKKAPSYINYATSLESQRPSSRKRFNNIFTKDGIVKATTVFPL